MTVHRLPPDWTNADLAAETRAIVAIYRYLWPEAALDLCLSEARGWWGDPRITDPAPAPTADTNPETTPLIARIRLPGTAPGLRVKTGLPPPPRLAAAIPTPERPLIPGPLLRGLIALHPAVPELPRHLLDRYAALTAHLRHRSRPVPPPTAPAPATASAAANRPPAILIGMHWLEVGGAERLAFDCIKWARAAGLRVILLASVPAPQALAQRVAGDPGILFLRVDRYLPHALWPEFVTALVAAENVRLIHIHHCQPLYDALPRLRGACPDVTVIDSTHIVEHADGGYPRISGVWTHYIDHHHVISADLAAYFTRRFPVDDRLCLGRMIDRRTIPHRLPPPNLRPETGRLRLAFVGRLSHQKRPLLLFAILRAAIRHFRAKGITVTATILGHGAYRPVLESLIQRHGLSGIFRLLPPDADVPELLEQSDILLLPSANEGLALVGIEALRHGCLPISSDVGAQSELLPPALLVPAAPLACLRQTLHRIDRLWHDPAHLDATRRAVQDRWQTIASDPTAEEVITPLYARAAGTGQRRTA